MIRKMLFCLSLLLTSGIIYAAPVEKTSSRDIPSKALPATYAGTLPCADCESVRWQINLLPDHVFYLRQIYLKDGEKTQFDRIGQWKITEKKILQLQTPEQDPVAFQWVNKKHLQLLDQNNQPIKSKLNYKLKRMPGFKPIEPSLMLSGMYSYQADAGTITLCETKQTLPVAMEAGNAVLETAYMALRKKPGEPLLASVEGRIAQRQIMEEAPLQSALIVERFIKIDANQSCQNNPPSAALNGAYWKLIYLADAAIEEVESFREPYLFFDINDSRVFGSGGCNRIVGGYELSDHQITFGPIASTRMACGVGEKMEYTFISYLEKIRSWKITDGQLELIDESGNTLARFVASEPPQKPD